MSDSSLGHRTPLSWFLLPLVVGLVLAKLAPGSLPVPFLLAGALGGLLLASGLAERHPTGWAWAFSLALVAAGAAYYDLRRARLPDWEVLPPREARVTVEVERMFHSKLPGRSSGIGWVRRAESHLHDLEGQQLAFAVQVPPGTATPIRGSVVTVAGLLEPLPRRPGDDPFLEYLVSRGANFRLSRGRLLEHEEPSGRYARWREQARQRASERLGLGLDDHPAEVAALRGMLLGERHGLGEEQESLYLRSGAMHLFAISGLHIGVIAGGIIMLLRVARVPPLATFLLGSALLWGYVDLTGALPSAVRAWLMVVALHGSRVLRAPGNPLSALAISAVAVLLLDPMQLFGAGFQMSYAIVAALLLYGLPMREKWLARLVPWRHVPVPSLRWWHCWTREGIGWALSAVAISVAATSIGMASGVAFFGLLTPTAVIVNVLLIPLATGAILAGFLSLVTGIFGLQALGLLFNHAAALILQVMQAILEVITALPFSSAPARFAPSWLGPASMAFLVAVMLGGYCLRWRVPGGYWLPPLVLVLLLIGGVRLA
jgi:competence protein ComEC